MDFEPSQFARRDLERIRELMDRAKDFKHLPPEGAFLAGLFALAGAWATQRIGEGRLATLGAVWLAVFLAAAGGQLWATWRAVRRDGASLRSPLTDQILNTLWPPLLAAAGLTFALAGESPAWIPPVWMLCYGVAGVAVGNYARGAVRGLGFAFLVAGLACLVRPFPPAWSLGATFGGFHLVYGLVLMRPPRGAA